VLARAGQPVVFLLIYSWMIYSLHFCNLKICVIFAIMKFLRDFTACLLLLFTFLLCTNGAEASWKPLKKSTQDAIDKIDFVKDAALIAKPYTNQNICDEQRTSTPVSAKWFVNYIAPHFIDYSPLTNKSVFIRQDIDRCHKVSLLLFPFHIFW